MAIRLTLSILFLITSVEAVDTLVSMGDDTLRLEYALTDRGRFGHRLTVTTYRDSKIVRQTKTYIRHEIYRFCAGDIDGDGTADVCIGVVKTTRFDPMYRKRLFIYTHRSGVVSPLWMGSKVGNDLQDFVVRNNGRESVVRTVEENPGGGFNVGEYRWQSFGLVWKQYMERGVDREKAFAAIAS